MWEVAIVGRCVVNSVLLSSVLLTDYSLSRAPQDGFSRRRTFDAPGLMCMGAITGICSSVNGKLCKDSNNSMRAFRRFSSSTDVVPNHRNS